LAALALLLAFSLVTVLGSGAAVWMIGRAWKRRARVGLPAKLVAVLAMAALLAGMLGTFAGVIRALAAIGGNEVEPSQKARQLAEGISDVINCTAALLAVLVPSAIVLFLLTMRGKAQGD